MPITLILFAERPPLCELKHDSAKIALEDFDRLGRAETWFADLSDEYSVGDPRRPTDLFGPFLLQIEAFIAIAIRAANPSDKETPKAWESIDDTAKRELPQATPEHQQIDGRSRDPLLYSALTPRFLMLSH